MKYRLKELASLCGGELLGTDATVMRVSTDSRTLSEPDGTLFVALRSARRDGNRYIAELYRRGVRAFLTDSPVDEKAYPLAGFVRCADSLEALQKLAADHRTSLKGTVVAITGSNGKTVVKEWIAQLCPPQIRLFRSPKSYNSQIGVALSLLMAEPDDRIVLIEAGISQRGEMARLERMIRPDLGIVTNIGDAHQENFDSPPQKADEKLTLFEHTPTIVYNAADPLLARLVPERYDDRKLIGVEPAERELDGLPFDDPASRANAALALALYGALGFDTEPIRKRLPRLQSVAMRLELKDGINGCKIVNDTYNSDINSLEIALQYLSATSGNRDKVLILSDIDQSGLPSDELYARVAELVRANGISELIGIGEEIFRHAALFDCRKEFYLSTDNFLKAGERARFVRKSILLKGGRRFRFERIGRVLENKIHTTVLEVDLDRMLHNLNYFRGLLRPGERMMAMVKAAGYGSGTFEVANLLERQGVDFLAVAFADEGVTLREAGITMPIVVLNADSDSFDLMLDYRLEPEIYSRSSLRSFTEAVRRHGAGRSPIHIKLDTGMHRLGFERADIEPLIDTLRETPEVYVRTVFTHLAGSDEARHDDFTRSQIALFRELSDRIAAAFPELHILRHIDNSAGIERFPEAQFDMVRLGIGLYGIGFVHQENLLPVSTLRSRIVQIKEIPVGDTVGYGRHGVAKDRPVRTATVPIGYADGLNRRLSCGRWSFIVNGRKAPIFGNICMDTCMIDITGIDAREGDTVTIFGDGATVIEMAEALGTIPYEIMTSVSTRVKRVYTKE